MRFTLLLALSALSLTHAFAQESLLAEYDFSRGYHTILMLPHEPYAYPDAVDTTAVIAYFDQASAQNSLKEALVFPEPAEKKAAGCPDYLSIHVCRNGKAVKSLMISDQCKSITSPDATFDFDGHLPLEGYKLARRHTHAFENLTQARQALDSLRRLPEIILVAEPEWHYCEGKLQFTRTGVQCTLQEVMKQTMEDIKQHCALTYYQISASSSTASQECIIQLWCTKKFADQFKLYPGGEKKWMPFTDLTLESYHRTE